MSSSDEYSAFGVILFHSVQGAIRVEKILLKEKIANKLIPVPRRFSSDCGFCLRFSWSEREKISQLLGDDSSIEAIRQL